MSQNVQYLLPRCHIGRSDEQASEIVPMLTILDVERSFLLDRCIAFLSEEGSKRDGKVLKGLTASKSDPPR
jgi:hypothetical protein